MLEFGLVALPLILSGVVLIEAAHWHITRQIAYVALLDSARAGATQQARRDAMERAFMQALLPRLVHADGQTRNWHRIQRLIDMPAWWIEIVQPDAPHRLYLRLTYLHEPLTPLLRGVIRRIGKSHNGCTQRAWAQGLIAMRLDLEIERHSPPMDWRALPTTPYDHIVYGVRACMTKTPQRAETS